MDIFLPLLLNENLNTRYRRGNLTLEQRNELYPHADVDKPDFKYNEEEFLKRSRKTISNFENYFKFHDLRKKINQTAPFCQVECEKVLVSLLMVTSKAWRAATKAKIKGKNKKWLVEDEEIKEKKREAIREFLKLLADDYPSYKVWLKKEERLRYYDLFDKKVINIRV